MKEKNSVHTFHATASQARLRMGKKIWVLIVGEAIISVVVSFRTGVNRGLLILWFPYTTDA